MLETLSFIILIGLIHWLGLLFHRSPLITTAINIILAIAALYQLTKLGAPFWPSSHKKVHDMVEIAQIKPHDVVYELGSGDGRILREAYKYKPKRIVGLELSWLLILYSRLLNHWHRQTITYVRKDFFTQDYTDASVVFCFLLPGAIERIEQQIRPKLTPWTRIVCNIFLFPHLTPTKKVGSIALYVKQ